VPARGPAPGLLLNNSGGPQTAPTRAVRGASGGGCARVQRRRSPFAPPCPAQGCGPPSFGVGCSRGGTHPAPLTPLRIAPLLGHSTTVGNASFRLGQRQRSALHPRRSRRLPVRRAPRRSALVAQRNGRRARRASPAASARGCVPRRLPDAANPDTGPTEGGCTPAPRIGQMEQLSGHGASFRSHGVRHHPTSGVTAGAAAVRGADNER